MSSVDCAKYFDRLSELLDGELDSKTEEDIRAHIDSCPECVVCWSTFKKSVELFKNLGPEPMPENLADTLKKYLKDLQT